MKIPTRPHTLYIPDHLWDQASVQARLDGSSTAAVVVEALRTHLTQMDPPIAVSPTIRPQAEPLTTTSTVTAKLPPGTTVSSGMIDLGTGPAQTSLEQQQAAQRARDEILRGSRKK